MRRLLDKVSEKFVPVVMLVLPTAVAVTIAAVVAAARTKAPLVHEAHTYVETGHGQLARVASHLTILCSFVLLEQSSSIAIVKAPSCPRSMPMHHGPICTHVSRITLLLLVGGGLSMSPEYQRAHSQRPSILVSNVVGLRAVYLKLEDRDPIAAKLARS